MTLRLPDVQYNLRPGIIELRCGHPHLDLFPVEGLQQAVQAVLTHEASPALSYGAEQGAGRLIEQLRNWFGRVHRFETSTEQLMITGGSSQALDMLCMLLTEPGDVALVQSPTYHLALRIMQDHQLQFISVPSDKRGLDVGTLEKELHALKRQGKKARLLYLVPTYANPSGESLDSERRKALVRLTQRWDIMTIEDDVYRDLWYDTAPAPTLYSLAPAGRVVQLGSFSKILAPGLRLGWMWAAPEIVRRCVLSGVLDSGGGLGHFTAHMVAAFMEMGLLDRHVETLRAAYRQRRDVLIDALQRHLPQECRWVTPGGGFFVWLRLPPGMNSGRLLATAESGGVSYIPGERFYVHGGGSAYCRLNFTFFCAQELEEGGRRLGAAIRSASGL